jgi:hypothetical protein
LIREARLNQGDLTVVWLDLANAYGSVPHQLIMKALDHYYVPEHVKGLIRNYYDGISLRFTTGDITTNTQRLEKGIVTGCTISVILFVMAMNLILKAAERETRGPKTESGIHLPANRGFMDDMTVTTQTHIQARWILQALDETVTWARMRFKPRKSRSLIIRKGRTVNNIRLQVQQEEIPSITESPIKCLGKWFDASMTDKSYQHQLHQQVKSGLKQIDQTKLPGKYKLWLYQNGLLPRLIWPLTVYQITTTTVEGLERTINRFLRRWLGVPPSFTSIGLYGHSNKLQLPLSSFTEEFKVAKVRLVTTLQESEDDKIRNAGITTLTGRKWSASQAVERAKSSLAHKDIVGTTSEGRQGLGMHCRVQWREADSRQKRTLIQKEVRDVEEETRQAKAVQLGPQGAWTRWTVPERKLTWKNMWNYEPLRLSFLLRSVYDLLPSPANLYRWSLADTPDCPLCGQRGTLEHILSSCKTALTQGRYRWRHDNVLRTLADILEKEKKKKRPKCTGFTAISFVREGEMAQKTCKLTGILPQASDWELQVDLDRRLVFPVVQTNLRPDIVLWSARGKKLVMIELTVPWEERCEVAHETKKLKYTELQGLCQDKGWTTWLYPLEVGCRGFPAQSV